MKNKHFNPRFQNKGKRDPNSGGRLVMGRNCLEEIVRHKPDSLIEVVIEQLRKGGDSRRDQLLGELRRHDIPIREVSPEELTDLVDSDSHQGFVGRVNEITSELGELLERHRDDEKSVILLLDSIVDPHNVGAILRAAECFGVHGVVWSKNRGVDRTPVVSKVSVGASELVPCAVVSNLADGARKCKDQGYWLVGAEVGDGAVTLSEFDPPGRVAVILGAEGDGIHDGLRKLLDFKVFIPMRGEIDSLNVSQAAAVMLFALTKVS